MRFEVSPKDTSGAPEAAGNDIEKRSTCISFTQRSDGCKASKKGSQSLILRDFLARHVGSRWTTTSNEEIRKSCEGHMPHLNECERHVPLF